MAGFTQVTWDTLMKTGSSTLPDEKRMLLSPKTERTSSLRKLRPFWEEAHISRSAWYTETKARMMMWLFMPSLFPITIKLMMR